MEQDQTLPVRTMTDGEGVVRNAFVLRDHRSEFVLVRADGTELAKIEVTMWIENTGASIRIRQDPDIHIEHVHYNPKNLIVDYGGRYYEYEVSRGSATPRAGDIPIEPPGGVDPSAI